jgi:hypothetical protein
MHGSIQEGLHRLMQSSNAETLQTERAAQHRARLFARLVVNLLLARYPYVA